ncbi:pteridine reductase [Thioalkalivibrio paradoxus]|uniref:Pteridine reductase n=1 Tax=Thioalkalivibrio paradoxus ARh 1 TaxID=713585 RepID=W0DM27_9GAMM|nr:pteridine reductase [Thioalkalivibrio paradoxus]AHE99639.1 pteridine reductase [Thioalkalivibrio paradoxus ARh 1]
MAESSGTAESGRDHEVVLITGAARRIGAEIARTLHRAGIRVLLHYRGSREEAATLAAEMNEARPDSARLLQADLLDERATAALAERAVAEYGHLNYLVNNASTFYPTPVGQITREHWDDLMGSNLKAPLFLTQACAPALREARGAVVNIVDIHALRPLKDYPLYSAAKAGLWALTQAYARELGPEVRVNGVAPGAILLPEDVASLHTHDTMVLHTALKREGDPSDIARTVLFLLREAPYITGQVIPVDGGRSSSQ